MTSLAFTTRRPAAGDRDGAQVPAASAPSARGVMAGMIRDAVLAIFFVPVFFVFVMKIFERGRATPEAPSQQSETASPAE